MFTGDVTCYRQLANLVKSEAVNYIVDAGTLVEVDHPVHDGGVTLRNDSQIRHERGDERDTGRVSLVGQC